MAPASSSPKTPSSGNSVDEETARQVRKRLDEVVGTRFDESRRPTKWVVAALLAIGAAALVVYVIESHRLPSDEALRAAAQRKPVQVIIVPSSKNKLTSLSQVRRRTAPPRAELDRASAAPF